MHANLQIQSFGENSVILFVPYYDTSTCVSVVRAAYRKLTDTRISGIQSIRPGLDCLLIQFEESASTTEIIKELQNIEFHTELEPAGKIARIPVCYDPPFGRDLPQIAEVTKLSPESIVELHCSVVYTVWMIGFMPGFPYLGELPKPLHIPRKPSPDPRLPAGSVAIAEEYVGVYPFDSPGGWHVLGCTPLRLADYQRTDPWLFHYGDQVQFYSITKDEFEAIQKKEQ